MKKHKDISFLKPLHRLRQPPQRLTNIFLWNIALEPEPEELAKRACRMANRDLAKDEWNQYIGPNIPYEPTCPDLPLGQGAAPVTPAEEK